MTCVLGVLTHKTVRMQSNTSTVRIRERAHWRSPHAQAITHELTPAHSAQSSHCSHAHPAHPQDWLLGCGFEPSLNPGTPSATRSWAHTAPSHLKFVQGRRALCLLGAQGPVGVAARRLGVPASLRPWACACARVRVRVCVYVCACRRNTRKRDIRHRSTVDFMGAW